MLTIATKVEQLVNESPFLTEAMSAGLINLSELARQMRPQLEAALWKPVGQGAVVMALRRLAERLPQENAVVRAAASAPASRMGELTTRTELAIFTFLFSDATGECQRELLTLAESYPGLFISITRGAREMLVVCNLALTGVVEQAFRGERLLARVDQLTALTVRLNPETRSTPGIYHAILKRLASNRINLINITCTYTELTILIEPGQAGRAFSVLSQSV